MSFTFFVAVPLVTPVCHALVRSNGSVLVSWDALNSSVSRSVLQGYTIAFRGVFTDQDATQACVVSSMTTMLASQYATALYVPAADTLGFVSRVAVLTTLGNGPFCDCRFLNRTDVIDIPTNSTSVELSSDSSAVSTIVGATVGSVVGVTIVIVLLLLLLRRQRRRVVDLFDDTSLDHPQSFEVLQSMHLSAFLC